MEDGEQAEDRHSSLVAPHKRFARSVWFPRGRNQAACPAWPKSGPKRVRHGGFWMRVLGVLDTGTSQQVCGFCPCLVFSIPRLPRSSWEVGFVLLFFSTNGVVFRRFLPVKEKVRSFPRPWAKGLRRILGHLQNCRRLHTVDGQNPPKQP